jgi:cytosine/adenosine deaminase-related metal-dependent hydrolase
LWQGTRLRVISFRELIRLQGGPAAVEAVKVAVSELDGIPKAAGRLGLSPHATYTTTKDLLEAAAAAAQARRWPLTTHVAESEEEFEMFMYRHGPMFQWMSSQRDMADCGLGSPVQHLERCGYLDASLLAVHVNYLWRHDAGILGRNRVSVVHCPRSHDYFRHLKFARHELESAGVNLCLGTDSLATTRASGDQTLELSLFAEMQSLAASSPELDPEHVLRMATVNPAQALKRRGQLGELSENATADLVAVPYSGAPKEVFHAVVQHCGPVSASMIDGRWVFP